MTARRARTSFSHVSAKVQAARQDAGGAKREDGRHHGSEKEINFGSQIRSYVLHPYQQIKDHRTDIEYTQLQSILDGDLDPPYRILPEAGFP